MSIVIFGLAAVLAAAPLLAIYKVYFAEKRVYGEEGTLLLAIGACFGAASVPFGYLAIQIWRPPPVRSDRDPTTKFKDDTSETP